jgi:O-antigen/teichoic acid export membrane protein
MIKQFFRNASVLSITEIILKAKGLILIPLMTHYFGALNYGLWSQVTIIVSTLTPLIFLGTDNAVIMFLPGLEIEKQKKYYSSWVFFILSITLLFSALIWIFNPLVSRLFFGEGSNYTNYIIIAIFSLIIAMLLNVFRNWFRIHNIVKTYAVIAILQAVINIAAVLIVLVYKLTVINFIQVTLVGEGLMVIWLFCQIWKNFGWSIPDFSLLSSMVRFGLPLVPAGYAMWGLNSLDRIFLAQYSTLSDIGIYSTIYSLGYLVIQLFVNPIWTLFPNSAAELFNQGKKEELQRLFNYSTGILLAICLPCFAGLFLLGDSILTLLTPVEFLKAAPIISIVAVGYFFLMISAYFETSLGLIRKQYLSTVSILAAFIINVGLNFLLIPRYSIFGAGIATSLAFISQFICSFLLEKRFSRTLETNWFFVLKIVGATIGMTLILTILETARIPQPVLAIIFTSLVGVLSYSILLFLFGVINKPIIQKGLSLIFKEKIQNETN